MLRYIKPHGVWSTLSSCILLESMARSQNHHTRRQRQRDKIILENTICLALWVKPHKAMCMHEYIIYTNTHTCIHMQNTILEYFNCIKKRQEISHREGKKTYNTYMMEVTWLFVSSQETLVPFKMFQKQLAEESCVVFETLKKKSYSHFYLLIFILS